MRAAAVTGAIYDRWQALGGVDSDLGLPISSEAVAKDGVGRYSVFEGGVIYWHPQFGAWEVKGLPLLLWKLRGGVNSGWGYPTGSPEKKEGWTELQNFSKGRLDTLAEFLRAKSTIVGGRAVNSLVVELLPDSALSPNIDLNTGVHIYSTYPLPETPNDGGVSIPSGYDYKGPNSGETLADFCTNSPDQFPNPVGKNADFRGACARHDLCYSGAKEISWGETFGWTRDNERVTKPQAARYRHCNSRLGTDMNTVCRNVYSESYKTQFYCIDTAAVYETAVTAAHAEHYFPVVNGQVMTGYIGEY